MVVHYATVGTCVVLSVRVGYDAGVSGQYRLNMVGVFLVGLLNHTDVAIFAFPGGRALSTFCSLVISIDTPLMLRDSCFGLFLR